jgi:hypothetical protein
MLGQYTSFGSHSSAVLIWLEQACRWPSRCHALAGQLGGDRSFCVQFTAQPKGTTDPRPRACCSHRSPVGCDRSDLFRSGTKTTSDSPPIRPSHALTPIFPSARNRPTTVGPTLMNVPARLVITTAESRLRELHDLLKSNSITTEEMDEMLYLMALCGCTVSGEVPERFRNQTRH